MKKKIKILYIVSTLQRCGPTNQLFNIVSNLDPNNFECIILTLSKESNDTLMPKFLAHGIRVESLELTRISGFISGWKRIKRKVKSYGPDIVHTQGIRADGYAVRLKEFGIKTVATIRCIPHEDYPMKYGKFIGRIMANQHLHSLNNLDIIASVSRSINNSLNEVGLKTTTIQNGCDLSKYTNASIEEKIGLRDKLRLSKDKIILISVGHLSNRKDPQTIIQAFKKCFDHIRFQLIFVGDGELREDCESMVEKEDIKFIGRVDNVNEYLQASDVFISASISEGLPNTVLESLSCGIPTILSNIPQHTEIFEGYIQFFDFFEIHNTNELTMILDNLTLSQIQDIPTRSIIEKNFDSRKMSSSYQTIYKNLI